MATSTRIRPVCHRGSGIMSQRGDHRGDDGQGPVDVCIGGVVAEGEPDGAAGQRIGDAHGRQHVARLEGAAGTRRSSRRADAPFAQRQQELLALDTGEAEMEVTRAGWPPPRRPCGWLRPPSAAGPPPTGRARRRPGTPPPRSFGRSQAQCRRPDRPPRPRPVCRCAAPVPGLHQRVVPRARWSAARGQHPDPDRSSHLVGAERDEVGAGGRRGQVHERGGLHGVGEDARHVTVARAPPRRPHPAAAPRRSRCWPA